MGVYHLLIQQSTTMTPTQSPVALVSLFLEKISCCAEQMDSSTVSRLAIVRYLTPKYSLINVVEFNATSNLLALTYLVSK